VSTQWQQIKPSDILSKEESHTLRQRSNVWGFWLLLHCWGIIAGSMTLYAYLPNIFTLLFGIILVGGRQLGLSILMHEGSHGLLFKNRILNERLTQWLTAWPMILNIHVYRVRHMAHHRFTRTDKDPENYLYTPFPVTQASMGRKFLRDLTGIVFLRTNISIFCFIWGEKKGRSTRLIGFYGGPLLFNIASAGTLAAFGRIDLYLLFWLLPMATTYQLFLRVRNIAEHAAVEDLDDPLKNSRTTLVGPIARAMFAPYWVNFHIEHHMLPFVPCYRLPTIHKLMLERGFGERMAIVDGYGDVLRINASA